MRSRGVGLQQRLVAAPKLLRTHRALPHKTNNPQTKQLSSTQHEPALHVRAPPAILTTSCMAWQAWRGMASVAWCDMAWRGRARRSVALRGTARQRMALHGTARQQHTDLITNELYGSATKTPYRNLASCDSNGNSDYVDDLASAGGDKQHLCNDMVWES